MEERGTRGRVAQYLTEGGNIFSEKFRQQQSFVPGRWFPWGRVRRGWCFSGGGGRGGRGGVGGGGGWEVLYFSGGGGDSQAGAGAGGRIWSQHCAPCSAPHHHFATRL